MSFTCSRAKKIYSALQASALSSLLLGGLGATCANADVAQAPLFVAKYVPGNLALVPSVEFPTILSMANLGAYSASNVYTGYFDSRKCYRYRNSGVDSHFYPASVAAASDPLPGAHQCSSANQWSGNFLNWATTQTIDPFRSALTGGYRVVDDPDETILEKARHDRRNANGERNLGGSNSALVNSATAATSDWNRFYTRVDGLGNRMYFSRRDQNDNGANDIYGNSPSTVHYDPNIHSLNSSSDNAVYEVYVRVKVCDESVGLEANCIRYSEGYKPEGLIQEYSQQVRYSVFGYLNDSNMQRDGGVLRANQKFVGPARPTLGGGEEANPAAEWDATTGVLVRNPDEAAATSTGTFYGVTVQDSGVINYLNKFGQLTTNAHKSHDPVSELFYTAVRYFKNQGCVPEYVSHNSANTTTRNQWVDGFPVLGPGEWDDPLQYRCQKNVILGIGDTNTHADRNLPGGVRSGNEPALPAAVVADDTVNVRTATERLEQLEGTGLNAGNSNTFGSCCNNNSTYIAGLAYDSHAGDLRPTEEGRQSVSTYWVDVRENGVLRGPSTNQYWLAAKYGGFTVPAGYLPYERTEALPAEWWSDGDTLVTNTEGTQDRPRNFFVASDAAAMVTSLRSAFRNIVADMQSSASSVAANSTRLDTETLIYQASFNAQDWTGRLRAYTLDQNDGSVESTAWDTNNAGTFAAAATRNIFTANGTAGVTTTAGIDFSWATLPSAMQQLLQPADSRGQDRLNWLRGDLSQEAPAGVLRQRTRLAVGRANLLGDIVNSDPAFVGSTEDFGYQWLPGAEGSSYQAFLTSKAARDAMLYVGANDGMLHGFNATTGVERFAYVPLGVFANLHELTSPTYGHRYYVDGSPRSGDAYVGGAWRTVLVGSTGAGGKSVFALDVTDPAAMGPSKLLWEFSTAPIDAHQLELAMSQPVIARVQADIGSGRRWVAIFGNGYGEGAAAKLFVVDLSNGALVSVIETGVAGAAGVLNGLSSVIPVDVNNDRITDYVYGGDLQGNLWRFDMTAATTAGWSSTLLFRATDTADEAPQSITARPTVGRHPHGGVMVYFGTGKYFETSDATVPDDPQVQTFYGIRDVDGVQVDREDLLEQSIVFEGRGTLVIQNTDGSTSNTLTDIPVRAVSANDADEVPEYGWRIDLIPPDDVAQGERVVSTPILRFGRIIFTSIIPTEDPCDYGGTSWLMELAAITGGRLDYSALDVNNDRSINQGDFITLPDGTRVPTSGQSSGEMIDTPGIVGAGENEYKYTSGSSGSIGVTRERGGNDVLGRQSWRQLR